MKLLFVLFIMGLAGISFAQPSSCQDLFAEKTSPHAELPWDLRSVYQNETQNLSSLQITYLNKKTLQEIEAYEPTQTGKKLNALSFTKFSDAYRFIEKQFMGDEMKAYEKDFCSIGFCFGRAYLSHLVLLKLGLQPESIRKVWAVGAMNTGTLIWDFHVATAAYINNFGWMVLDPVFGRPIYLKDWIATLADLGVDKRVRLYITDPRKFGISHGKYSRFEMGFSHSRENDWYSHYFVDHTETIRNTPPDSLNGAKQWK